MFSSSKIDDENDFDNIKSNVEYRIAFIERGNYNSDKKKKKKQGSSLVHRSLVLQRTGALAVVIIDNDSVDNTRFEYCYQYFMIDSSKEDGDDWGDYDWFRL